MKLNIDKLKNMPNKNKIMIGVGISLIIVGLISTTYFVFNSKKAEDTKNIEVAEKQEEEIKEIKEIEAEEESAEKELEEAKKSGDEKSIKEAEEKVAKAKEKKSSVITQISSNAKTDSKASNTTKSSSDTKTSTPTASTGTSNNTQTTPKEPEKKKVWVVDVPATTKTVEVPVQKSRKVWIAKFNDRQGNSWEKKYYSRADMDKEVRGNPQSGAWRNEMEAYTVMEKQIVKVEEQGHWEYR